MSDNMTPKEKAKQLVNRYSHLVTTWDCRNDEPLDLVYKIDDMKKCAIILVDEILKAIDWHEFEFPNREFIYWEQVREEILKIN